MAYIISIISSGGPKNYIKYKFGLLQNHLGGHHYGFGSSTWNTYGLYEVPEVVDVSDAEAAAAGALLGVTVVVLPLLLVKFELVLIISALYL